MHVTSLVLSFGLAAAVASAQQPVASCKSASECAQLVVDAIAASEFEHANDLAWRAVQLGPRNDTALMYLLARTQSLIGRPQDALVMLRRLAALGFRADDVETSEDFRRVRSLPDWPDALAAMRATAAPKTPVAPAVPAEAAGTAAVAPGASASPRGAVNASPGATSPVAPGLRVPASVVAPLALAYDSVSDRFVVLDESSGTLKVVDERTGRAIDLVSPGWSGAYRAAALAIDPRRGDLWAAAVDTTSGDKPRSVIYKLQLVSGRLLQTIELPDEAGPARVVALAVGEDTLFLLDALGRRVFSIANGSRSARVAANLVSIAGPFSIAAAGDAVLYVAHAKGLARVDLAARTRLPTPVPAAANVTDIQSISWHDGSLFAIQRTGAEHAAARIRLNARGTTATALETLGPAASPAAGVYGGVFYYVAPDADSGGVILRGTRAR